MRALVAALLVLLIRLQLANCDKVVCTSHYPPVTVCGPANNSIEGYSGYELDLFKLTANLLYKSGREEWAPGKWSFSCSDNWAGLLLDLSKPPEERECDVVISGVSATAERKLPPYEFKFSYPTYRTGRRVMIYKAPDDWLWLFLKPFSTELWLVFFATSVAAGLCIFALEADWGQVFQAPMRSLEHVMNCQWASMGMTLRGLYQLTPRSVGGRIVALGYAFTTIILISLYIASLASILCHRASQMNVKGLQDLALLPIGIYNQEYAVLKGFSLYSTVNQSWSTTEDTRTMLANLRSGIVQALLLDATFVDEQAALNCDLQAMGDLVSPVNFAFAFPKDTLDYNLLEFDLVLRQQEEGEVYEMLAAKHMRPEASCRTPPFSPGIKIYNVGGLWIILGSCTGIAILLLLPKALFNACVWSGRSAKAAKAGVKSAMSSSDRMSDKMSTVSATHSLEHRMSYGLSSAVATEGEAVQELHNHIDEMDSHVQHLPFVIAATLDAKLSEFGRNISDQLIAVRNSHEGVASRTPSGTPIGGKNDKDSGSVRYPNSNAAGNAFGKVRGKLGLSGEAGTSDSPSVSNIPLAPLTIAPATLDTLNTSGPGTAATVPHSLSKKSAFSRLSQQSTSESKTKVYNSDRLPVLNSGLDLVKDTNSEHLPTRGEPAS